MLPKKHRLTSEKDFQTIYRHGVKHRGKYGMLIALPSPSSVESSGSDESIIASSREESVGVTHETAPPPQFGFVVSKKIGNAVVRHKMTRWLRSIVMEHAKGSSDYAVGYKCSYVAYEMPESFAELEKELKELLARVGR